ncbi:MAG: GlsB/YeaQ/YmgE family stress response membrane protein [Ramlibacter sp.]
MGGRPDCCHHGPIHGVPWHGVPINPFIWVAVGAATGLLAGVLMRSDSRIVRIEEICVGIFGAFIGGEFLPSVLGNAPGFSGLSLAMGIGGAVVMLLLLKLMRRKVGPMRNSRSRSVNRN